MTKKKKKSDASAKKAKKTADVKDDKPVKDEAKVSAKTGAAAYQKAATDIPSCTEVPDCLEGEEQVTLFENVMAERDKYLELAQKTQAELENFRRRVKRERDQLKRDSLSSFLSEFLGGFDDLSRVIAEGEKSEDYTVLHDGVKLVGDSLWKVLKKHGIVEIEAEGKKFDPNFHEAMTMIPIPDKEPGTVAEVFQAGYMMDDFVLRPSKVVVVAEQK